MSELKFETIPEILALKEHLLRKWANRNYTYQQLRQYYNAEYFSGTEVQGMKLIYNLMAAAVDRYTDFMIQTPEFRSIPLGSTKEALLHSDKLEKLLISQYQLNDFSILQGWASNLQAMLGMFCFEVRPVFDGKEKVVHIDTPPPEYVLPLPRTDNIRDLEAVIIIGDQYIRLDEQWKPDIRHDQKINQTNVIKFYDKNKIVVIRDNVEVLRLDHKFGFIPLVIGQNRIKPHFIEGASDMEQAAGLQQYYNELLSAQGDIIEYAANPIVVTEGNSNTDPLPTGPGAQWNLSKGATARFLQWQGSAPTVESMLERVQRGIEDLTFMGDPTFGRNIPSGTSGSAVRTLLSGIQAAILRKQVTLGTAYTQLNAIILKIIEKEHGNKKIVVRGTRKNNIFYEEMTGKDIQGNYLTQTIWPPGILDQPSRVDIEISKMNAKVQSRYTTMENIGVISPQDERQLIREEEEEELEREILRQGGVPQPGGARAGEFQNIQNSLNAAGGDSGNLSGSSPEQQIIEAIKNIPKIKGDVYFAGRKGDKIIIAISEGVDKSTILNRLPKELKSKVVFQRVNDDELDELVPIIEQEEAQV